MAKKDQIGRDRLSRTAVATTPSESSLESGSAGATESSALPFAKGSVAQTEGIVISFVIPARNEEQLIPGTIESIHNSLKNQLGYEIIVVDNGSSDSTPQRSASHGAQVIHQFEGTIGSLRNTGARHACGEILVFLDADVVLTEDWAERISATVALLLANSKSIAGSLCDVPMNASWIERTWFAPPSGRYSSHIGTGHMLLSRRFFNLLGGFDESLVTGEDYDLSQRARSLGASIFNDELLRVEHLGFPKTLNAFFRREIWHGTSDFQSIRNLLRSKVALIALTIALLHAIILLGVLTNIPLLAILAAVGIALLCVVSSMWKYRRERLHIVASNSFLFYFYYAARSLSALRVWTRPIVRRVA